MATKKNFTNADGAINKFFTPKQSEQAQDSNITNDTNYMNDENDTDNTNISKHTKHTNNTKPKNKSKHYEERGKRAERFGLLLDERLKEDLVHLSKAKGSKSVNDLIITILLEYVERVENQTKLDQYRKLLQE